VKHSAEARRIVEALDIESFRRLWPVIFPQYPALNTDADVLTAMHYARTSMKTVAFKSRAYSHAWLVDRGIPSGLPDNLKPKAERIYPVTRSAVGIMVHSKYPEVKRAIRGAMEGAVLEAEADNRLTDSDHVKGRMQEARRREIKRMFG
jgi:hypothetical protein